MTTETRPKKEIVVVKVTDNDMLYLTFVRDQMSFYEMIAVTGKTLGTAQKAITRLRKHGFIETKEGPKGGTVWRGRFLTEKGIEQLAKVNIRTKKEVPDDTE